MGFSFQSSEARNPTPQSHEQLQALKAQDSCTEVQAKLSEIEEFIDENRLLQKFFAWQALREQMRDTGAEVIEE
jgi:predicted secreted Zn-dependent protease